MCSRKKVFVKDSMWKRKKMSFLFISLPWLSNKLLWSINNLKQGLWCTIWLSYSIFGHLLTIKKIHKKCFFKRRLKTLTLLRLCTCYLVSCEYLYYIVCLSKHYVIHYSPHHTLSQSTYKNSKNRPYVEEISRPSQPSLPYILIQKVWHINSK